MYKADFQCKIVVFCSLMMLILISCQNKQKDILVDYQTAEVQAYHVEETVLDDNLHSFGTTSFRSKNDVTVQVSGTITNFMVKEGSYVKKNDVIAILKNIQMEIQKEQCESSLDSACSTLELEKLELKDQRLAVESRLLAIEKAELNIIQKELELSLLEADLEKQKELHNLGGVTDAAIEQFKMKVKSAQTDIEILKKDLSISKLGLRDEDIIENGMIPANDKKEKQEQLIKINLKSKQAQIERAEAGVKSAKQQLTAINKMLEEMVIKAPVSGIIGQNYYENGEYIEANQKITTIIDTSTVYAIVNIQEQDMVHFARGTEIQLKIPSLNKTYTSIISEISPIADVLSGNFSVKAVLPNKNGEIKPGMFLTCSIQRQKPLKFPSFPDSCVVSSTTNTVKVFFIINGFAVSKILNYTDRKNGSVWCSEGISSGDILINNPSSFIKEGQKVTVR